MSAVRFTIIYTERIPYRNINFSYISETALGVKLDDIHGSAMYRKVIHDIELIIIERVHNPLLMYDTIFKWFGKYNKHMRDLKIAHDFSSRIIEKRRKEFQENGKQKLQQGNENEA